MPKALSLAQNSFAVMALFAIIALSFVTTLGLSPVVTSSNGEVAGVAIQRDPKILSNFIPLEISDANDPSPVYTSQLVQVTQSQYQYTAKLPARDRGTYEYKLIHIVNPNTAAVRVKLQSAVAKEVASGLNVSVTAGDTYRLHSTDSKDIRVVDYSIPAESSLDIKVDYEVEHPISFPFEVSFSFEY